MAYPLKGFLGERGPKVLSLCPLHYSLQVSWVKKFTRASVFARSAPKNPIEADVKTAIMLYPFSTGPIVKTY
jgi:hypothetical protein